VRSLDDVLGQLGGGIVQPGQVRALAMTVFGDILDEHQARFRRAVWRNLPFGFAHLALDKHVEGAFPALAISQSQSQFVDDRTLVLGKALAQSVPVEVVLDQLREGMVAFVNLQLCIQHSDGRRHIDNDFPKPRLACTQGIFSIACPQQGAQRRQGRFPKNRSTQNQ
jgi:hypothetical protein